MGIHHITAGGLISAGVLALAGIVAGQSETPTAKRLPASQLTGAAKTAFLKKVEARMKKVTSVVAAFEQTKHLSLFGDAVVTHGHILYNRPDLLRWEIQQPFQSILIVAKSDVAKFEFRKGKRRRLKLGRGADIILMVMDQIRSWFRGDFTRSTKNYDMRIFTPAKAPARIELRPKNKAMAQSLQVIELELSKSFDGIDQVTIREQSGDYTVMKFRPLGKNPKLPARTFDPKDPSKFDARLFPKPPSPKPRKKSVTPGR